MPRDFKLEYLTTGKRERLNGLAFPFRKDGAGGYATANEGATSLKDCIQQLIMTAPGERVMRPSWGTSLRISAFEPNDSSMRDRLEREIKEAITTYEPRVIVKKLSLIPNAESNKMLIKLTIAPKNDYLSEETVEILV